MAIYLKKGAEELKQFVKINNIKTARPSGKQRWSHSLALPNINPSMAFSGFHKTMRLP